MRNMLVVLGVATFLMILGILAVFGFALGHGPTAWFVSAVLAGFAVHIGQEMVRERRRGRMRE